MPLKNFSTPKISIVANVTADYEKTVEEIKENLVKQLFNEAENKYRHLLEGVLGKGDIKQLYEELTAAMLSRFSAVLSLAALDKNMTELEKQSVKKAV